MNKDHDNEELYIGLIHGMQLYRVNRFEDAIEHFLNILSQYPDSLEARFYLAMVFMKKNDYAAAVQQLLYITKHLNSHSDYFQANVWSLLGICQIQMNYLSLAMDAFQKSAKINPSIRSQEIFCLNKYLKESPLPPIELYQELGDCYFDLGNDFRAEEIYMKFFESGGNQTTVIKSLAQVYERIHKMKQRIMPLPQISTQIEKHHSDQIITWVQLSSHPLVESRKVTEKRRKRWEPYYMNGNRILEFEWCNKTNLHDIQDESTYDGVMVLTRENTIPTLDLLNIVKQCFKWANETGKIIIIIESSNHMPVPLSSKTLLETILNSAGWSVKEKSAPEDEESFYILSQKTNCEVLWQSPLFNSSGYAEEQNQFLDALRPYPLLIKLFATDMVPSVDDYPADMKLYLLALQKQQIKSPVIHYQAAPAEFFSFPMAPISIGRTMFETDSLPKNWVEMLNEMTEIWVPSKFNQETFASAGVNLERIKIIPEPLDENKYNPINMFPYPLKGLPSFKFLSVFDWSARKGWELLIRAYFEEFSEDEDVSLILKVSKINEPNTNPYSKIKDLTKKLGLKKLPHIHIIQETLSQEDMIRLYAAADCFVLPSRGEGWGRPYMEAMAMELPTIGTRWSGQLAFMNDDNSYLINLESLVSIDPNDGMPAHFHGHRWADPSVDHLKELMRHVFNHPTEAKQKGLKARKHLFPRFSSQTIGQQIYQRMDELIKYYYS